MTMHRTFTLFATLAFASLAAHAVSAQPYGEQYPVAQTTIGTLTRAEVVADLIAARKAGTMPGHDDWLQTTAPQAVGGNPRTREEVRAEAIEAAHSGFSVINGED